MSTYRKSLNTRSVQLHALTIVVTSLAVSVTIRAESGRILGYGIGPMTHGEKTAKAIAMASALRQTLD